MKSIESDLFGHPRGIFTLFLVEMWERFSYYGMRAFLILYMTAPVASGGLGFEVDQAGRAYGFYTGGVWLATIGGGLLADWFLGRYLSVTVGAILIILGHITLAFPAVPVFFGGLFLIVVGTGFLKPNISAMAGSLYHANDPRRDAGFSIFYMGINLGAAIGPIVAGFLAQRVGWHLGFACAALGMVFGLFQLYRGRNYLLPALKHTEQEREALWRGPALSWQSFSPAEWKRLAAILIFFLFASIFWAAYEQAGTTLNLFADRYTRLDVWGFDVPSSWFQSVPAVFVIVLAPLFAALWMRLGSKGPASPIKFAIGLFFAGLSFLLLVPAASMAQSAPGMRVSPLWLVGVYFFCVVGELCVSPVGLSLVTKLSPGRIVGLLTGIWLLSLGVGNIIAGWLAGLFETVPLAELFKGVAFSAIAAAAILCLLTKPIQKLMGGLR